MRRIWDKRSKYQGGDKHFNWQSWFEAATIEHYATQEQLSEIENTPAVYFTYKYTTPSSDYDLLSSIAAPLQEQLFANENFKIVIDFRSEGAGSVIENRGNFYNVMYNTARKHNLNPRKFILMSSNLRENVSHQWYLNSRNITDKVNTVSWQYWQSESIRQFINEKISPWETYKQRKPKRAFLSFNRRPHPWRILLIYMMKTRGLDREFFYSADVWGRDRYQYMLNTYPQLDPDLFAMVRKTLPVLLDTATLEHNLVHTLPWKYYNQTGASIITESESEIWEDLVQGGISRFYSEKTFKAMLFGHPFAIIGQRGAQRYLKELGYHNWDNLFDCAYDARERVYNRCDDLVAQLRDTVDAKHWQSWHKTQESAIRHNIDLTLKETYNRRSLETFVNYLNEPV